MVFEVRASHAVTSTGVRACEVHPDVFVDETGRVFWTGGGAARIWPDVPVDITSIESGEENDIFVVEDEVVEVAVDWVEMLRGDRQAEERIAQRRRCRWSLPTGSVTDALLDVEGRLRSWDKRTVEFEVRASHISVRVVNWCVRSTLTYSSVSGVARYRGMPAWLCSNPVTPSQRCLPVLRSGAGSGVCSRLRAGCRRWQTSGTVSGSSSTVPRSAFRHRPSVRWGRQLQGVGDWRADRGSGRTPGAFAAGTD